MRLAVAITLGALTSCAAIAGLEEPGDSDDAGVAETSTPVEAGTSNAETSTGPPTASIELLCNGTVLKRHTCPNKRWEYDPCPTIGSMGRSLVLHNNGAYPVSYIARQSWSGGGYKPGIPTDGSAGEKTGFLAPNARAEIASSYNGATIAIFGSVRPFAEEARTSPRDDEGRVPWPNGDFNGIPATEIDVAQMTVTDTSECWNILAPTDRRHFD